jgi:LPS sulfotransferase NodH
MIIPQKPDLACISAPFRAVLPRQTRPISNYFAIINVIRKFTSQNLAVSGENLQGANSRIRDADMANEMMRLAQVNVLQQAASFMIAQANQAPQMVLQLLGR